VFFERNSQYCSSFPSSPVSAVSAQRRKKLMMLGLAVAMAAPAASFQSTELFAAAPDNQRPDTDALRADFDLRADFAAPVAGTPLPTAGTNLQAAAATDADLLKQGQTHYASGEYEAAVAALKQVNASNLSDRQRRTLSDTLNKAESAASERAAARAEFDKGEAALKAGNNTEAITHYQAASANQFADPATKAKSLEQIKLAQGLPAAPEAPAADANTANPADASATNADAPAILAPDAPAASADDAATPVADAPTMSPKQHYQLGVKQFKSGDWIAARTNFNAAVAGRFKAGLFQDSPEKYLARMDKKEQADAAKHKAQLAAAHQAEAKRAADAARDADVAAQAQARADAEAADAKANADSQANADANADSNAAGSQTPAAAPTTPANTGEATAAAPTAPVTPPVTIAQTPAAPAPTEPAPAPQATAPAGPSLLDQANEAVAQSRYDEALTLFDRALAQDPQNTVAAEGRQRMLELTGRGQGGNLLARERAAIEARRAASQYNFNDALGDANEAIRTNDFDAANTALQRATVARATDPTIFTRDELNKFDARIANSRAAMARQSDVYNQNQIETARQQAIEAQAQRNRIEAADRERTIKSLIDQTQAAIKDGRYKAAEGLVAQILNLDPRNDYAIGVRPFIEDQANFQEQRRWREEGQQAMTGIMNDAAEKMIPYNEIIRFPENWPDLSATRDRTVAMERGEGQQDAVVQAQLDKRLPELRFDAVGLTDVIDFLRDVSGANIFVNWRALEGATIDRNAPVTARLRDVPFRKALDIILQDVGGGTVKLAYTVDEGVITISTAEELATNTMTQTYDIRDLIINVPDFDNAPTFDLTNSNTTGGGGSSGSGGGGGGSSSGGLFSDDSESSDQEQGPTRDELVEKITALIQNSVAKDTWEINGGTIGTLSELNGTLIVTQTPENQGKVNSLLEKLREQRAIQVTVEARFLTVQRNFLEDIGMDFDFRFNTEGAVSSSLTSVSLNNASSDFTVAPKTGVPGTIGDFASGLTVGSADPAGGPAAFTFLDDFQVNFLIRATQAAQTSTSLTAPRITLFNGQRAYVVVSTQRAYVSDLTPTAAQNAIAFDPEISTVESGVKLDVQATVSADRKYVTLTLRPELSTLVNLFTFSFAQQSSQSIGGGGTGVIDTGSVTSAGTGLVQQQEIQRTRLETTVSVPDGGTLLLGGQTLAGEIEKEAGVPVLSKIPFLKRLFTNRSSAKDEQVLLILVKPTIIISREVEEKSFPLLSTRAGG
jgi:general secretion pathway protein D